MTKKDLINSVVKTTGLTRIECEAVIDSFMLAVIEALKEDHRCELRGFGIFRVVSKESYKGRNPKTGESIIIPTKRNPIFKFSKEMKKSFREG